MVSGALKRRGFQSGKARLDLDKMGGIPPFLLILIALAAADGSS